MIVKILYFASLREALGCNAEDLALPAGVRTVAQLRSHLATRGEPWTVLEKSQSLRVAVNQQMASMDSVLDERDEVAFFPPVTGG